jgi:hypothetical protein
MKIIKTDNYLAIKERAAGDTDLHAHVENRHHGWMDHNDAESRTQHDPRCINVRFFYCDGSV